MLRQFIQNNINLTKIFLFLVFFIILIIIKPGFIFDKNGRPREFGLGYKNKTVIPIWLAIIIIALFLYLIFLNYLNLNKFLL